MPKVLFVSVIVSFFLSLVLGKVFITLFKKLKTGQPILKYVENHKAKSGTPTMGGLFFIISALIVYLIFCGFETRIPLITLIISLAFMFVGFIDDFIKLRIKNNEGLKPYQKIIFQLGISLAVGIYAYKNNLTLAFVPFSNKIINLGYFTIPFVVFAFIATTNSVNLTDGLDGLAGSTSITYLIFLTIIIFFEVSKNHYIYIMPDEYEKLMILSCCFVGSLLGFLVYNVNPAKVFMGDTGSLALGGVIASISIFSLNSFYILIIGIMFVFSSISVIIQVIYFKKHKKRVFKMTPFHHHLQLCGYSETRISYIYLIITGIMGIISIIFYL